MSNILTDKFKNNRSKWFLMAILLVSFFTFSGIVLKPQVGLYVQRTTLVANPQTGFVSGISYKLALQRVYNNDSTRLFFTISTFDISRIHSRQICTRINSVSMSYKCRTKIAYSFLVKNFTQNAGDYPVIHLG